MISLLDLLESVYDLPKVPTKRPKVVAARAGQIRATLSPKLQQAWDKAQAKKERKNRDKNKK